MQRKIIHTTSTKIGPTRCGPVVTKELFQTRLPSCLRDGRLTYPKPNFLTFGQYIKWFPQKSLTFYVQGVWRGEKRHTLNFDGKKIKLHQTSLLLVPSRKLTYPTKRESQKPSSTQKFGMGLCYPPGSLTASENPLKITGTQNEAGSSSSPIIFARVPSLKLTVRP